MIKISFISGFEDSNDNAVDAMTAVYTVADITSPTFDSSSFSSGNRYISIVMTEAVWGLDDEGELIGRLLMSWHQGKHFSDPAQSGDHSRTEWPRRFCRCD